MSPRHILVPFLREDEAKIAFRAAHRLAKLSGGHLCALHMRQRLSIAQVVYYPLGGVFPIEGDDAFRVAEDEHASKMRKIFDDCCKAAGVAVCEIGERAGRGAVTASWRDETGFVPEDLARIGSGFDVIVLAAEVDGAPVREELIEECLSRAGRPVLIAAKGAAEVSFDDVVIAWNESPEAARAATAAAEILVRAKTVRLLTVRDPGSTGSAAAGLAATLKLRGVAVVQSEIERKENETAEKVLLREIAAARPGVVVMGAYSRSRFREAIFGGFTRSVLKDAPFAAFMTR